MKPEKIIEILKRNETAGVDGKYISISPHLQSKYFGKIASEIRQLHEAKLGDFLDFIRWKTESKWEGISLQSEYFEHTNTEIIDEYLKSKQNERLKS